MCRVVWKKYSDSKMRSREDKVNGEDGMRGIWREVLREREREREGERERER